MVTSNEIQRASILIVDDLEANIAVLEQMLQGAGYTSISSTRIPEQVCELQSKHQYDLILLDLLMPGMDGFQVLEKLKDLESDSYLPVLVITAQPDQKLRALQAGAKDFVSKPFNLAEVLTRVYNLIEVRLLHQRQSSHNKGRLDNSQRIARMGDWEYDFNHRLIWSEGVYRILGLKSQDCAPNSESFYRQVHPDDLEFVHQKKKCSDGAPYCADFEHRIIRPDGEVRYIHQITETHFDDQGRPSRESGTIQDVTERKLADTVINQSEERYRKLLTISPDANFVHVDGVITMVNLAFCQLMGATTPEQLIGCAAIDVVHNDHRALAQARQRQLANNETTTASDMKFVRLDGSIVDVEVTSVGFEFCGRFEILILARDITTRKRSDEELREKTALLEAQVDSTLDGILIVDPNGEKILQNRRIIELLQLPELLVAASSDENMFMFVASQMRNEEAFCTKVRHLYAHPDETSRDELELKNGTVLDRYSSPVHDNDGKNYGRIWTFRDVTSHKNAERALRNSEERFKFVARAVSDVVWDWDLLNDTLWWNDGFLKTFGFVAGEIDPSVSALNARIHPDERRRVLYGIQQALANGAETWNAEYSFECKDGSFVMVQNRAYILRDADGKAVRMVGGMRDLTEQKKMEAQYLRAQRMDSIGTLAGGIAHDLNNVLAPIMMAIELLKTDDAEDQRRSKILNTIDISCRRGADLVKQVLSFARGVDGKQVIIRLGHILGELKAIICETFPRNIQITVDVAPDLWSITGDPTQLHQVLLNLAVNARDAMPEGGKLMITAVNVTIDAQYAGTSGAAQEGTYVMVQMSDTGTGIPPEVKERIFEPFFTTKEIGKGTGIGLATVQTAVKSHGGFLKVESEVGHGTSFKVFLPADTAHGSSTSMQPFAINMLPHGKNELILVVDDELSIRDITQQTLEAFGYRVITAGDGAQAIAMYAEQTEKISLVLTDMMMPIIDGKATIQVLLRINPEVRVIAVTGLEVSENIGKETRAGVFGFLPKPYTAQTLLELVREVIDRPALSVAR